MNKRRGKDTDEGTDQSCPKCGAPRLGHAWDCGKCGYLFDAAGPAQLSELEPATTSPSPPATESAQRQGTPASQTAAGTSARRGGEARSSSGKAGPATRHTGLRGWVDQNLPLAITLAVVAFFLVYVVLSTQLVSSTDDATAITTQYRAVVGESPPTAFQPVMGVSLVGRRTLFFVDPQSGQFLLLYHEGWLAGGANANRLASLPDKALDFLDVPYRNLGERSAKMLHLTVDLRAIDVELSPHSTMRRYVATFTGNTERPAILCLVGQSESVVKMARTMFRER